MKIFQSLLVVLIAISLSACTVQNAPSPLSCAIAGAGVGGAGAAAGYSADDDDADLDEVAAAGGIGAVAGALIGYGICLLIDEEAPPPPPRAPLPKILEDVGDPCEGIVHLQTVNFDFDSDKLRSEVLPILDGLAVALQRCPQRLVRVEAHTDSIGSEEYNLALSDRRAAAVYMHLTGAGVPSSMLESKGHGEAEPIATNETEEGRSQNRRVELEPIN
jgi:OOP family OmpA-OmpF porin